MRGNWKIRIFIGLAIVAFGYFNYCNSKEVNPYTGREQAIALDPQEEIAMGLQSAPQMAQEYGGLYPNQQMQDRVDYVGQKLVNASMAKESPYQYDFHLLADEQTINAFALPGGFIGVHTGLLEATRNEDELAELRGQRFGFIFQSFYLIPTLTALENVVLSAELNSTNGSKKKSLNLLSIVGL